MSEWQAQAMWESETSRIWEEMNAPDPNENRYIEAGSSVDVALKHLQKAIDWLLRASDEVEGLPLEDKLISLANSVEELGDDIKKAKDEWRN